MLHYFSTRIYANNVRPSLQKFPDISITTITATLSQYNFLRTLDLKIVENQDCIHIKIDFWSEATCHFHQVSLIFQQAVNRQMLHYFLFTYLFILLNLLCLFTIYYFLFSRSSIIPVFLSLCGSLDVFSDLRLANPSSASGASLFMFFNSTKSVALFHYNPVHLNLVDLDSLRDVSRIIVITFAWDARLVNKTLRNLSGLWLVHI